MLKYILLLVSLVSIPQALASGTVTLKFPALGREQKPEIGLFVYETLSPKNFYQSWTGGKYDTWFTSYHHFMHKLTPDISVGAGPAFESNEQYNTNVKVELVLQWQLWK